MNGVYLEKSGQNAFIWGIEAVHAVCDRLTPAQCLVVLNRMRATLGEYDFGGEAIEDCVDKLFPTNTDNEADEYDEDED